MIRTFVNYLSLALTVSSIAACATNYAYTGSYTSTDGSKDWVGGYRGKGIEVYSIGSDGSLNNIQTVTASISGNDPTMLAISNNNKFLFAVNEDNDGAVHSFQIDKANGQLSKINSYTPNLASGVFLKSDGNDEFLHVAYYSGSYVIYPLDANGNIQSPTSNIQYNGDSKVHMVQFSPDYKFVYATDLGLDKVHSYSYNEGQITPISDYNAPAGSGPRHIRFHPTKPFAYLVNELTSVLTVLSHNTVTGVLTNVADYSTVENPADANGAGAIHINDEGTYLYVTNRVAENNIVLYKIESSGLLTRLETTNTADTPREFSLYNSDKLYVLSQVNNTITLFPRNQETGHLAEEKQKIVVNAGNPVAMSILYNN